MKKAIAAIALLCFCAAPVAAAMDVATFLAKAEALKAKGPLALFSGDIKLLKAEMAAAGKQLQAEKAARDKAGLPPRTCPPKDAKPMSVDEFLNGLRAIPAAERQNMPLKDGVLRIAQRRYPCR